MTALGAAAVQAAAAPLDPAANAAAGSAAIAAAAGAGAGLVVLPELFATGYVLDRTALAERAENTAAPGTCLTAWSAAAARHGVTVVAGFAERDGDRLFNSAAVIDRSGAIAGVYRKLHLFGAERDVFDPGDRGLPVFTVDGIRLGVLICYDLRFPEAMRILALRGAHVVAVPTAWVRGFDHARHGDRVPQATGALVQANLNQVAVVCADQWGEQPPHTFLGRSLVADPYGLPAAGPLGAEGDGTALALIDLDEITRARERAVGSPVRDRRTDVYAADLGYAGDPPDGGER
ncbi:Predicted amidohydrolase [Thermomonospora echinospora]|uniref:Predicted amidohydrolase n=1 Tax=Thermomonospora echinospora TaxID=1992 RepID=A0A1H6E3V0_9ACTN|nr:nitrilase-related carbon-nitrogen hydrolase [Thermomonospora echinospora]SEG91923.1 Predicted amidohydrolase [Thermomonospora echinospora]